MPCIAPLKVRNKRAEGYAFNIVPCGKCPDCLNARVNSWVFRLMQEDRVHFTSMFVTLTYDNNHVPLTDSKLMTLVKSDVQKFLKRLRKNTKRKSIKYYAVGEYGGRTRRPHYHLILFDATEEEVAKAWTFGYVDFGYVAAESIAYTAKYINKEKKIPMWHGDDRQPEFSLMSKGMGKNYINEQTIKFHRNRGEFKPYVVLKDGIKQRMPRYYKEKIFNEFERKMIGYSAEKTAEEAYLEKCEKYGSEQEYIRRRYESIRMHLNSWRKNQKCRDKI